MTETDSNIECLRLISELLCDLLKETVKLISYQSSKGGKITIDLLSIARNKEVVASDGTALTILEKGTGTWSLFLEFYDNSNLELQNTELEDGDLLEYEFKKFKFTNTVQSVTNPSFIIDYRPIPK